MIKPKVDCMAGQNRDIIKQYPPYTNGRDCLLYCESTGERGGINL